MTKNFDTLFKSFFPQDLFKKYIKDKTSVKGKMLFTLLQYRALKIELSFTNVLLLLLSLQIFGAFLQILLIVRQTLMTQLILAISL